MSLLENRLFFILALFLTIIVAAGTSFLVLRFLVSPMGEQKESPEERRELGEIYEYGEVVVNLGGTDARRFIRIFMVLELSHRRVEDEIESRRPQIQDRLISMLRVRKVTDFAEDHQINDFKKEIIDFINPLLSNGTVYDVYFTEFVIQ